MDCIHTPCEYLGYQRHAEWEDSEFVGPVLLTETQNVPVSTSDWYLEIGIFENDTSKPFAFAYCLLYSWNC